MEIAKDLAGIETAHEAKFLAAGSVWRVSSNSPEILQAFQATFQPVAAANSPIALDLTFLVRSDIVEEPPWPEPYFRGLDHLVYAGYGWKSAMLIDLRTPRVIGLFSPAMARDIDYWRQVLLPVLLGVVSSSVMITPLHCACLVKNGHGLVVAGASGAGKSTLALSLSLRGFAFLSDDWTYFTRSGSRVRAWGLPIPMKLLPDTIRYFPALSARVPAPSLNGELAIHLDPEVLGVPRELSCEPRWVVFIERTAEPGITFQKIASVEAASRFASDLEQLPPCLAREPRHELATINAAVDRDCWVVRHGVEPDTLAQRLCEFCEAEA
jgi:hypothetical protein